MGARPAQITIPEKMPRSRFVTEAQLAALVKITPRTIRSWRSRGEAPPIATGPEAEEFAKEMHTRGRLPTVYRVADVSAWIFGVGGPGGLPKPLPASAFDPALGRTGQIRMAAEATPDLEAKDRLRQQLTMVAKKAASLAFKSPTAYEDWLKRGAPEDELPPECRAAPDAPIVDDDSSERLQLRSDAAIAKIRGVSPRVVTAERKRAEPLSPPQPPSLPILDDDIDPFASNVVTRRRGPRGYFSG